MVRLAAAGLVALDSGNNGGDGAPRLAAGAALVDYGIGGETFSSSVS